MTVEAATYLQSLDAAYPATGDQIAEGDDHLRMVKAVLKNTFPGRGGEDMRVVQKSGNFTPTTTEVGVIFNAQAACTCTLPVLAGVTAGTHYFLKATGGALTVGCYGAETLDGLSVAVLAVGTWALVAKNGGSWTILPIPASLSGAAIVSLIGNLYVANATFATSANYATYAGSATSATTSGSATSATMADTATNAGYATRAGTADSASTLQGYVPGNFAAATHYHSYAGLEAFVGFSALKGSDGEGSQWTDLTLTRADGSTLTVRI